MNKLEKYSDQTFRKRVIYKAIRKYGVENVTEMLGLGIDQDSLTYAYSNKEEVPIPNDRWMHFTWEMSKRGDKSIVRHYVAPETLVTLRQTAGIETNGCIMDEMKDMVREIAEINKHITISKEDALQDVQDMRDIIDRYETEIRQL